MYNHFLYFLLHTNLLQIRQAALGWLFFYINVLQFTTPHEIMASLSFILKWRLLLFLKHVILNM